MFAHQRRRGAALVTDKVLHGDDAVLEHGDLGRSGFRDGGGVAADSVHAPPFNPLDLPPPAGQETRRPRLQGDRLFFFGAAAVRASRQSRRRWAFGSKPGRAVDALNLVVCRTRGGSLAAGRPARAPRCFGGVVRDGAFVGVVGESRTCGDERASRRWWAGRGRRGAVVVRHRSPPEVVIGSLVVRGVTRCSVRFGRPFSAAVGLRSARRGHAPPATPRAAAVLVGRAIACSSSSFVGVAVRRRSSCRSSESAGSRPQPVLGCSTGCGRRRKRRHVSRGRRRVVVSSIVRESGSFRVRRGGAWPRSRRELTV